jgi:hypothetical protein
MGTADSKPLQNHALKPISIRVDNEPATYAHIADSELLAHAALHAARAACFLSDSLASAGTRTTTERGV